MRKTKDLDETYCLQYGPPSVGSGISWDSSSWRMSVCADRMVVVFEPANETYRRDDMSVGLLRWMEGVPSLGAGADVFAKYKAGFRADLEKEEEERRRRRKTVKGNKDNLKKQSRGSAKELARGRDLRMVRGILQACIGEEGTDIGVLGIRGAVKVAQTLDDAYWTGSSETPKVLGAAWSPAMCSCDGGSIVAVVFDDGSLMVYSKSVTMTAFWVPEVNLSCVCEKMKRIVDFDDDLGGKKSVLRHKSKMKAKAAKRDGAGSVGRYCFVALDWSASMRDMHNGRTLSVIAAVSENGAFGIF
jgi:hypothetical protein